LLTAEKGKYEQRRTLLINPAYIEALPLRYP